MVVIKVRCIDDDSWSQVYEAKTIEEMTRLQGMLWKEFMDGQDATKRVYEDGSVEYGNKHELKNILKNIVTWKK